jgi:hypothetical protein
MKSKERWGARARALPWAEAFCNGITEKGGCKGEGSDMRQRGCEIQLIDTYFYLYQNKHIHMQSARGITFDLRPESFRPVI